MAEDLQTGPESSKMRPAIGARLAMICLAAMAALFVLIAAVLLAGVLVLVVLAFVLVDGAVVALILRLSGMLALAGMLVAMGAGAKWVEGLIRERYEYPGGGGPDPVASGCQQVVMMLDIVVVLSGFSLVVWIPAEISGMSDVGFAWPAFWLLVGGLCLWGQREISKRLTDRALSRDRGPCSTPGTPPSGEP
jgi:hypothetical protein